VTACSYACDFRNLLSEPLWEIEFTRVFEFLLPQRRSTMPDYVHRSERRYAVQQPAWVRIIDQHARAIPTVTENVSNSGFLLRSELPVPLNSQVEINLLLPSGPHLKGTGHVVRVEKPLPGQTFLLAVKCDHPLEIDTWTI
jgi:hypothetical protein